MADTTLNPEDLLKLAGVEEGFINKNINVLYLSVKSIPKEFFFTYCVDNNTDYVFLFSSIGELNSALVKKLKVLFP